MREISKSAATDLELVNAIKSENKVISEKAFSELYKKYHNSMLLHFKGLIKDKEDVNDLVMEAFAKMSDNLEKFNDEAAVFSTWFFKLTRNLFIDRMRKEKRNVAFLADMATYDEESNAIEYAIPSPDSNPENKMLVAERNREINEIINSMENKELSMFVKMRFFEGMSYEEMSRETGKPLGTVKAYIFRAKIVLKEEFKKANISM